MMSGLMGNAVVGDKGGGVIKDINHYAFSAPAGAPAPITVNIDTCDPQKAVVFFYGAGWNDPVEGALVAVYPYLFSLNSTQAIIKMSDNIGVGAGLSVSVIEYI